MSSRFAHGARIALSDAFREVHRRWTSTKTSSYQYSPIVARFSSTTFDSNRTGKGSLLTTPTCPPSTCDCRPMPPDLNIDHEAPLRNTVAAYAEHVVLCTGRHDWPKRVEDATDGTGAILRGMKTAAADELGKVVGVKEGFMLANSLRLSASSLSPSPKQPLEHPDAPHMSAYLLPSFLHVPHLSTDPRDLRVLARRHLTRPLLACASARRPALSQHASTLDPSEDPSAPPARPVTEALVLVCGHGSRDARCGALGPVLVAEFAEQLVRAGVAVRTGAGGEAEEEEEARPAARVGVISHVGGHHLAGNVIVYVPRGYGGREHALGGMGVWYGRVEPRHVEGIVAETVVRGRIVEELFRGGIDQGREMMRLP